MSYFPCFAPEKLMTPSVRSRVKGNFREKRPLLTNIEGAELKVSATPSLCVLQAGWWGLWKSSAAPPA